MAKNKKDEEHEIVLIGEKISKIPSSKVGFICTFWFPLSSISSILKQGQQKNHARRRQFHQYVGPFLPRDHGGFGHKNQKMSDFLGIAQKVRHFLILVPKTAMISWQKLSGKSMEPNVASFVVISIGLQTVIVENASLCITVFCMQPGTVHSHKLNYDTSSTRN